MIDKKVAYKKLLSMGYQNSNNWELTIIGSPADLKFRVKSAQIPYTMLETKTANTGEQFVTNYTPEGDFTMEFFEDENWSIHNFLLNWRETIFKTSTRTFGYRAKKIIYLKWYNDKNEQVFQHTFRGTIIKGLNTYNVTYDDNTILVTSAVFVSDAIDTIFKKKN